MRGSLGVVLIGPLGAEFDKADGIGGEEFGGGGVGVALGAGQDADADKWRTRTGRAAGKR